MKTPVTLLFVLCASAATAACPEPDIMYDAAAAWAEGGRLPALELTSVEDGLCAYNHFREGLEDEFGRPVGVKVGFTSKPAQEKFGVTSPVAGALFGPMLLPDGGMVHLAGSRTPFYEADLIVTVADEAINTATTREEVAAALADVRPFVELPDLALAEGVKPSGPLMAAYGVLPWRGVVGEGVPIADLDDPVAALAGLSVVLKANGEEVDQATGEALLGHPLDVILWLSKAGGYELRAGSVISLGSLGKLHPAAAGAEIQADYMVGGAPMSVGFTLVE